MSDGPISQDGDYEPWFYCATCLSPSITHDESLDFDCCGVCGSTNIAESTFEAWEQKYERKYGHKYAEKSNDPRKHPIFKIPLDKLKMRLSNSPVCDTVIRELYRNFPRGLSRADSVILLFDKLIKDNRLDDLRMCLMKHLKI